MRNFDINLNICNNLSKIKTKKTFEILIKDDFDGKVQIIYDDNYKKV